METLGQFLKREREFRGMSHEDLSKKTKITVATIKTLEQDAYEKLPSGSYVKGYLKLLAFSVGVKFEDLMALYQDIPTTSKKEVDPFYQIGRFENRTDLLKG